MIRLIGLFLFALTLAGCRNLAWGPYVSPRVTGRVLAADTRQPLAGVKVTRGRPEPEPLAGWAPHGGELLVRKPPILTSPSGQFVLESERVLTLVRWGGWSSVRLTFDHAGYLRLQTNFSLSNLRTSWLPPWLSLLRAALSLADTTDCSGSFALRPACSSRLQFQQTRHRL